MRVQKCIEVNGHKIPDFRLNLGVDLYSRSTYRRVDTVSKKRMPSKISDVPWFRDTSTCQRRGLVRSLS